MPMTFGHTPPDMTLSKAERDAEKAAWKALDDEIARLRRMVRDAYNEGFSQGMREHTSSKGGIPWSDCKYRALVENT
jgi:hypothetical protein